MFGNITDREMGGGAIRRGGWQERWMAKCGLSVNMKIRTAERMTVNTSP